MKFTEIKKILLQYSDYGENYRQIYNIMNMVERLNNSTVSWMWWKYWKLLWYYEHGENTEQKKISDEMVEPELPLLGRPSLFCTTSFPCSRCSGGNTRWLCFVSLIFQPSISSLSKLSSYVSALIFAFISLVCFLLISFSFIFLFFYISLFYLSVLY